MAWENDVAKSKEKLHVESISHANPHREKFLKQLLACVRRRQAEADRARSRFFRPDTSSVQAYEDSIGPYRKQFAAMLGWPLTGGRPAAAPAMRQKLVARDSLGAIYRTWTRTLPWPLVTYRVNQSSPG